MEYVLHVALKHGYLLIFALVLLDQAAVSIPSPPFVTAMGVLASRGRFNIWLAFVVVFSAASWPTGSGSELDHPFERAFLDCPAQSSGSIAFQRSSVLHIGEFQVPYSALNFRYFRAHYYP